MSSPDTDKEPGSVCIISWMHTTRSGLTARRYRARGVGQTYDKFYEWLNEQPVGRQEDNWPWHSWEFLDAKTDKTIRTLWGEFFWDDEPDHVAREFNREERYAMLPAVDKSMHEMIGQIFSEELQKAINEEIITAIKK